MILITFEDSTKDDDIKNIGIGRNDMLCFVPNDFF